MSDRFSMNSYLGQRILSLVREGDYAHAGEEEAIELAMSGIEKDSRRVILARAVGVAERRLIFTRMAGGERSASTSKPNP